MRVVYVGDGPGRIIVDRAGDREILAPADEPVDVPDELGESLLEQEVWEQADPPARKEKG